MIEPTGFSSWNKAMRGAFKKGYLVRSSGALVSECPYIDKRKDCGRLTWSRAFRAAWIDGWDWYNQCNPLDAYLKDSRRNPCNRCDEGMRYNNATESIEVCGKCKTGKSF